jgi:hypothetical protein
MEINTENHLQKIIEQLKSQGIDTGQLNHIQEELQQTHRPWYSKLKQKIQKQWTHISGEIKESKRLIQLLKRRSNLDENEKLEVREQLADLFRMLPAGLIAAANAALPIPGTSMLTPLLLRKAGLLPSRWREAHILETLQNEQKKLESMGQTEMAKEINDLANEICEEADKRQEVCSLLSIWDDNQNGIWDPEEIDSYNKEVQNIHLALENSRNKRNWFLMQHGFVFGPTSLPDKFEDDKILISHGGDTKWVRFVDAVNEHQFSVDEPPVLPAQN